MPRTDLTRLLNDRSPGARELLASELYRELRATAERMFRSERRGHTLQPTAVVHEAWLRMFGSSRDVDIDNRRQFFAAAATTIRRVLVDHARRQRAERRGGAGQRVDVDLDLVTGDWFDDDLIALHDALEGLAAFAPDQARMVEMRFFAGLSHPEIAEITGQSLSSVERHWRLARAWLKAEFEPR